LRSRRGILGALRHIRSGLLHGFGHLGEYLHKLLSAEKHDGPDAMLFVAVVGDDLAFMRLPSRGRFQIRLRRIGLTHQPTFSGPWLLGSASAV
jgi:hypothetical protein